MTTIHKHPVPTDSYDPNRPLNDLLIAQLEHFQHISRSLPPEFRGAVPAEPTVEDREGGHRFIAAITGVHQNRKNARPRLVTKPFQREQPITLDIAAAAETSTKSKVQGKPKPKSKRGKAGG